VYLTFTNITITFDWGTSFQGAGDVWDLVFGRIGATFRLGLAALFLALVIGIPLGIYQAIRQYSFFDQLGTTAAFIAFSTPIFIVGVGLQLIFALYFEKWTGVKLFYVAGMNSPGYSDMSFWQQVADTLQHLVLPAVSIALISLAGYSRFQRASMLEVLHSDYLRTAKAKGLPRSRIIIKHALRNALIPIVTLFSSFLPMMLGGSVIIEWLFGIPGMGWLGWDSITLKDFPTLMALIYIDAIVVMLSILKTDILYVVVDPRISFQSQGRSE
jgi:peptide/nickel transport system permease protein